MRLVEGRFRRLGTDEAVAADALRGRTVHAVAGIGNPSRFFEHLRRLGLEPIEHPFPDHHRFRPADIVFGDVRPVIMTEKDAVKCESFADGDCWYLEVSASPDPRFSEHLTRLLKESPRG